MSNFEKAVEVLREAYREPSMSPVHACDIMATALEAAGLLMPDLPEPGNDHSPRWGVVHLDKKKQVIKIGINGVMARTPETARKWAYGLLAAADYAEKKKED